MLLARRQNMAPPKKAKNGHLEIGLIKCGAITVTISSFMLSCTDETTPVMSLLCDKLSTHRSKRLVYMSDAMRMLICTEVNEDWMNSMEYK